ncbi:hypothetical protein GC197_13260 [bacterium]|nr:hypothetical protein [bacterium]
MLDVESQMVDALDMLHRFLKKPIDGWNDSVRETCQAEVSRLLPLARQGMILPDPQKREELALRRLLDHDLLPLPIVVAAERFLELYENAPLEKHQRPVVDRLFTASGIPLTRVQNVHWPTLTFRGSVTTSTLTWMHVLTNLDLVSRRMVESIKQSQMVPCYEDDTASLQFKLFTRPNLADSLVPYAAETDLSEAIFWAMQPGVEMTDLLVHFQFMLTAWIEENIRRRSISLKEVVLSYCSQTSHELFEELMPPLSQIVIVDFKSDMLYHFGGETDVIDHMLQSSLAVQA